MGTFFLVKIPVTAIKRVLDLFYKDERLDCNIQKGGRNTHVFQPPKIIIYIKLNFRI